LWSFAVFRFLTGAGVGGEYSAVNSAIDELIPAKYRGRVDLLVNGSFWLGAAVGAVSTLVTLDPRYIPINIGWRLGFAIGPFIGIVILYLREFIPESPRWLLTHGYPERAEQTTEDLEKTIADAIGAPLSAPDRAYTLRVKVRHEFGLEAVLRPLVGEYKSRALLGLALMTAQAFTYNAIFFTYALVLHRYYAMAERDAGFYLLPFAISNFLGPLLLGIFFDTVGRRVMISGTFTISALILIAAGWYFANGSLTALSQTVLWTTMFFFASPAASSAYLTVSEIFPLEMRALAIAVFYSAGTAVGGIVAPWYFGRLIDTGSRTALFDGYMVAAGLMLIAAAVEWWLGPAAEGAGLEHIAKPLSIAD
ncbi:MAG TPA: MFS transporter, partial [Candidatus Binataceae bacterium]|nr:MFS transporter [Candidatus Binataceae bacterium]